MDQLIKPIVFLVALIVGVPLVIWLADKFATKCPKCGAHMIFNDNGYDKWDCPGCGYCGKAR